MFYLLKVLVSHNLIIYSPYDDLLERLNKENDELMFGNFLIKVNLRNYPWSFFLIVFLLFITGLMAALLAINYLLGWITPDITASYLFWGFFAFGVFLCMTAATCINIHEFFYLRSLQKWLFIFDDRIMYLYGNCFTINKSKSNVGHYDHTPIFEHFFKNEIASVSFEQSNEVYRLNMFIGWCSIEVKPKWKMIIKKSGNVMEQIEKKRGKTESLHVCMEQGANLSEFDINLGIISFNSVVLLAKILKATLHNTTVINEPLTSRKPD